MEKMDLGNLALLDESSEIAQLMHVFDWTTCKLGAPMDWPSALVTLVSTILRSGVPMIVAWGPELVSIYNDAYHKQFLGNKHPKAFGRPHQEIWSEIWSQLAPVIEQGWAGKSTYLENAPFHVQRRDFLEQLWATFSHSPIVENGAIVGALSVGINTTAQVLAERRQQFQLAFVDALRGLTNADDITLAATKLLGEHLGATQVFYSEADDRAEEFSTMASWSAIPLPPLPTQGRLSDFGDKVIATLHSGTPVVIDAISHDHRTAPYAAAYENINIRSLLVVPLVKSGRVRGALNVSRLEPYHWTDEDVTATQDVAERTWAAVGRARAEAALATERNRSHTVFDTMTEGFGMVDRNWTVLYMNAEGLRIGNRPGQQIVGSNHWELWPFTVGTDLDSMYRRVIETRQPDSIESQHVYADGTTGWLEVRAYPGIDGGLSIFFRDVNSRREAEEHLRNASRRKDEFLAMLAHELRNPLAPIGAAAQLLQLGKLNTEQVQKTSEVIGRQVNHMTGLIDDLLDVSRVTRGLIELDQVEIDIRQVVNEAVEQVNPLVRARRHELTIRLAPEQAMLLADKKRLVQVVANVLNNAAKYTAEGGHITLCTVVRDTEVMIEVTDDGIGMTPDMTNIAFDLFAQAGAYLGPSIRGIGIGPRVSKKPG